MKEKVNLYKILDKTKNRFVLVLVAMETVKKLPKHIIDMLNRENTKLTTYVLQLIQEDKVKIIEEK